MSVLHRIVDVLVSGAKGDARHRIAANLTDRQLASVLWFRGLQYVRGLPLRLTARGVHGPVFRGRRAVVEYAFQLKSGPGLILEDHACINALSSHGISLGRGVTIARGAILTCTGVIARLGEGITIGDRCAVGAGSFIGGQGGVTIGNDVIMGAGVRIFSENHNSEALDRPIRTQGETRKGVHIGDDCWIGAGATIVDGVAIGTGSVVAAGAVVTHHVPPYTVVAGVPARTIRSRRAESAAEPLPLASARVPGVPVQQGAHARPEVR